MGSACSSGNDVQPNPNLDKQSPDKGVSGQKNHDVSMHKLILLGPGDSGKTTLFKQMSNIYGRPLSEAERRTYLPVLANNVINAMKTLCAVVDTPGWNEKNGSMESAEAIAAKQYVEVELKGDEELDEKIGDQLKILWQDKTIQKAYAKRAEFQLPDSTHYFMSKIDELCKKGVYIPTEQDILRSRVRTTGIVDTVFTVEGVSFKVFDVGGQRNERKKWPHCFENVSGVIFVAALSEYDQLLHEDEKTNRLTESLNLFEEVCNSKWFKDTPLVLLLSKRDLFLEKCNESALRDHFPEATRQETGAAQQEAWIRAQFEARNKIPERKLAIHSVNLTDAASVATALQSVRDIVTGRPMVAKATRET